MDFVQRLVVNFRLQLPRCWLFQFISHVVYSGNYKTVQFIAIFIRINDKILLFIATTETSVLFFAYRTALLHFLSLNERTC